MKYDRSSRTWFAVLSRSRADSGSVTAEWALALPVVTVALAVVVSATQLISASSLLDSEAADAQRLIGLGVDVGDAQSRLQIGYGVGSTWTVSRPSPEAIVCVTLTREHPTLAGLGPAVELESTRCGLDGSPRE